jgi:hypothetical protein
MAEKMNGLKEFLSGYFHQDWTCDHENATSVVEFYLKECSLDEVQEVIEAIDHLLEKNMGEAELRAVVMNLGCYYEVGADGLTYREWLTKVRTRLAAG